MLSKKHESIVLILLSQSKKKSSEIFLPKIGIILN